MGKKPQYCIIFFLALNLLSEKANSQSLALPAQGFNNTFGFAVSGGVFFNKEAVFWGLTIDYSRVFKKRWIIDLSMGLDQEHTNKDNNEELVVNTLSPSVAFGYVITPKFAMGIGLGKGLLDDDNEENKLKFNKNGGWTIGLLGALTIYQKGHHGFDISAGLEQGLTDPETDFTVELGYGYSF